MTMLSTALQEYPDLRVVLLVDDPPNPRYAGPRKLLDSAHALPAEVERLLSEPRRRFDRALEGFEMSIDPSLPTTAGQVHALAGEYEHAGSWIQSLSDQYHVSDHNEAFFATHVLGKLATDLEVIAAPCAPPPTPSRRRSTPPGWPSSTAASPGPSAPRSRASSASASPRSRPSRTRR